MEARDPELQAVKGSMTVSIIITIRMKPDREDVLLNISMVLLKPIEGLSQ
jgi:hypothetical protein